VSPRGPPREGAHKFVVTTHRAHAQPEAPRLLTRRFAVLTQPGLDRRWAADITYVPTREGWLYLAVVLDLASRRVVGWAASHAYQRALRECGLVGSVSRESDCWDKAVVESFFATLTKELLDDGPLEMG